MCSCTLRQTQDANSLSLGENRPPRFANPERLDSSQRGMRDSLSQRERARVRGNETQPTKTAGRILPAQRERLSESELATTSSEKPVDRGSASGRKRIGVSSVASPSPQPSPFGERENRQPLRGESDALSRADVSALNRAAHGASRGDLRPRKSAARRALGWNQRRFSPWDS